MWSSISTEGKNNHSMLWSGSVWLLIAPDRLHLRSYIRLYPFQRNTRWCTQIKLSTLIWLKRYTELHIFLYFLDIFRYFLHIFKIIDQSIFLIKFIISRIIGQRIRIFLLRASKSVSKRIKFADLSHCDFNSSWLKNPEWFSLCLLCLNINPYLFVLFLTFACNLNKLVQIEKIHKIF